ncbi:MAG: GTP 3',8-cyclase MoaA [Candidatus Omnitrophica bacterium]|nr:GTP 3',8-cyclase MoaA [Candidatus Omnitrophota bacterium]
MKPLLDSFGRRIEYLRISVTDRCNLRCVYCLPREPVSWLPRQEILRFEEILEVVRAGAELGLTRVRLTGGEPLLRPGLTDLVAGLAQVPGLRDLALTTNGVLLARQAGVLARAGLKRVNVSLDTLDPQRFAAVTRFGKIDDVLAGIEAALEAGLAPVKINVVVMRGVNDDEIVPMARLAWERPLHVRFIELMPIGEYFTRERLVSSREILERLTALGPLEPAEPAAGCGPARTFRWAGAKGTVGVIGAVTQAFCAGCNRLRLTASGQLRPCLDDDSAVDLKEALRPKVDAARLAKQILRAVAAKPEMHGMFRRETGSARLCMAGVGG